MPVASPTGAATSALATLRANWGWFVALGLAFIVLGFIALAHVLTASVVTALYVGILIIIGGIVQIFHAFKVKGWGRFLFWLLAGVLYLVTGALMLSQPLLTLAVLTLFIGVALAVDGVFKIIAGLGAKGTAGWFFIVLSGVISLVLGFIIIGRWPENSLYILGLFLGIDLIMNGVATLAFGLAARKAA